MTASALVLLSALAARVPIELRIGPCVEADVANVSRLVGIEIEALAGGRTFTEIQSSVEVGCNAELTVVRVLDPLTDKTLERPVRLRRAAPQARSRLLALAIVELLVASWAELAAATPTVAPAPRSAREVAQAIAVNRLRPVSPSPTARVSVQVEGAGTRFFTRLGLARGGGLRVGVDLRGRLGLAFGLRIDRAAAQGDLGSVTFESLSGAPSVLARASLGPATLRGGVGVRGGFGRMTGQSRDAERTLAGSVSAAWGGPMVTASLGSNLWRYLGIDLAVEGGYVALPIGGRVAHVREVAVEGPWLGASLGLGWAR